MMFRVYPKFNFRSECVYTAAGMNIESGVRYRAVYYSLQLRCK